jgi:hypothetical protein
MATSAPERAPETAARSSGNTKWMVNDFTSIIPKEIDNISQIFMLNLNTEKIYKQGATAFDHFKKDEAYVWQIIIQLFLKLGERMRDEVTKIAQAQDMGASEQGEEDYIQFYVESVIKDRERDTDYSNTIGIKRDIQYTDHTFYILLRHTGATEVNGNKTFANMIKEVLEYHKKSESNINKFGTADQRYALKDYQKWMLVDSPTMLANLFDVYMGKIGAANLIELISNIHLDDDKNPLRATALFSSLAQMGSRSTKAIYSQSCWNWAKCLTRDEVGVQKLSFPQRKFVQRIPGSSFNTELMRRVFPEYQKQTSYSLMSMLPTAINDYYGRSICTIPNDPYDEIDPKFAGRRRNIQKLDEGMVIEDVNTIMRQVRDFGIGSEKDDEEDVLIGEPRTRADVLQKIAEYSDCAELFDKDAFPFDSKQILQSNVIYDKKFKLDPLLASYVSAMSPIVRASRRNENASVETLGKMKKGGLDYDVEDPEVVARKLILLNKAYVMSEYKLTCRTVDADMSPPQNAIINNLNTTNLYDLKVEYRKVDKSMSIYCNSEVSESEILKSVYLAERTREANLSRKYSYDAYRLAFDMHLNMVTVSRKGGKGKSFIWELMKARSVEGTVEEETDRSDKYDCTDQVNLNGGIGVYHEMKKSMIQEDSGNGSKSDAERKQKEKMTSQRTRARRLVKQLDGTFRQELTYTESISVFFGSTNLPAHTMMSEAFKTRVHLIYFEDRLSDNDRSMLALKLADVAMSQEEKLLRVNMDRRYHLIQTLMYEVENLIFLGGLTDVSMHAAMVILLIMESKLAEHGYKIADSRAYVRTLLLSRINCILDALITTFFSPAGKYFGKPIKIEYLYELDRKLFCCAQHVISAIGEQIDQYVDSASDTVKKAIDIMFENADHGLRYKETTRYEKVADNPAVRNTTRDPTYMRFKTDNFHEFCNDIHNITCHIPDIAVTASADTIHRVITGWSNMMITCHSNKFSPIDPTKVMVDTDSNKIPMNVVIKCKTCVLFNHQFIKSKIPSGREVIVEALKYIFNKKYQINGRYIFDCHDDFPYIRNVLDLGPTKETDEVLRIPSVAHLDEFSKSILTGCEDYLDEIRDDEFTIIKCDLDSYALAWRNKALLVTERKINPSFVNIRCFDIRNKETTEKGSMWYPTDDDYDPPIVNGKKERSTGYFMGDTLREYYTLNHIETIKDINLQIAGIVKALDVSEDDNTALDYDFNREDFFLYEDEDGERVYHWDLLDGPLSDPTNYKMMCVHPSIVDDFANIKCYSDMESKCNYPNEVIALAKARRGKSASVNKFAVKESEIPVKMNKDGTIKEGLIKPIHLSIGQAMLNITRRRGEKRRVGDEEQQQKQDQQKRPLLVPVRNIQKKQQQKTSVLVMTETEEMMDSEEDSVSDDGVDFRSMGKTELYDDDAIDI